MRQERCVIHEEVQQVLDYQISILFVGHKTEDLKKKSVIKNSERILNLSKYTNTEINYSLDQWSMIISIAKVTICGSNRVLMNGMIR
jgi:hypothetical protein